MARFNEQMKPIYELLKETEGINWSINEADRNNITSNGTSSFGGSGPMTNGAATLLGTNIAPGSTNGSFSSDQQQQNVGSLGMNSNIQDQYPVHIIGLEDKDRQNGNNSEFKSSGIKILPEVEALLLREENSLNPSNAVQESSHDEDMNDTPMTEYSTLMIPVGKTMVPVDKISDEHVELMTGGQREDYIRTMQLIYNLVYG